MFLVTKQELLNNLKESLNIGWKGILSLFIGMAVIFFAILILNKLSKKKTKDNK